MSMLVLLNPYISETHQFREERRSHTLTEMLFIFTAQMFFIFKILQIENNFYAGYVPIVAFGLYFLYSFGSAFKMQI